MHDDDVMIQLEEDRVRKCPQQGTAKSMPDRLKAFWRTRDAAQAASISWSNRNPSPGSRSSYQAKASSISRSASR
jgi:hypothetical protein